MNLTEALNVALPETPARTVPSDRLPKLDPNLVVKEQTKDGKLMVMVLIPSTRTYYPMTHEQWTLLSLFDGNRTYEEIAEIQTAKTSVLYTEKDVRDFAEMIADQPFWHRTAQEQNIALWEKLKRERQRRANKNSKFGNLAEITFSAWDPNAFLTKAYGALKFVFTRPFLVANLILFSFMAWVWIDRWGEIAHDSIEYYTFTHKTFADFLEFWVLIFFVGFVHESAHGLACKHTGGEVHRMGFLLIYLSPCFFCDTTEAFMFGSKWQRILTSAAGLWSELIICGLATIAWWGLPPGGFVHDISYKLILVAGLAPILVNLNPLIKLDGYYIFTEMLEISELKELSTEFTTSWVRKNIFRLPVEVPFTPWKRRLLFAPYSFLSAAYSYVLLFFVVTLVYNASFRYMPQWAFLPALALAWLVFRSRIRSGLRFLHTVYLDKRELVKAELKSHRAWAAGGVLALLFFTPIWRENVSGKFVLEPIRRSVIRAQVPGEVVEIRAQEGARVESGSPLVELRNLRLESDLAQAQAADQTAAFQVTAARLRNLPAEAAEHEREEMEIRLAVLRDQAGQLLLTSQISGSVLTPHLQDRLGSYVAAGAELAEVADLSAMRARVYVSENDLRKIHVGSGARLHMSGRLRVTEGKVTAVSPAVAEMEAGVMDKEKYIGLHAPHYYFADLTIPNPAGTLQIGMTGEAKIFVRRRSWAGMLVEAIADFASRKVW